MVSSFQYLLQLPVTLSCINSLKMDGWMILLHLLPNRMGLTTVTLIFPDTCNRDTYHALSYVYQQAWTYGHMHSNPYKFTDVCSHTHAHTKLCSQTNLCTDAIPQQAYEASLLSSVLSMEALANLRHIQTTRPSKVRSCLQNIVRYSKYLEWPQEMQRLLSLAAHFAVVLSGCFLIFIQPASPNYQERHKETLKITGQ